MRARRTSRAGNTNSIADQIRMLATLRDHGIITDREFEAATFDLRSEMLELVSHRAPPMFVRGT